MFSDLKSGNLRARVNVSLLLGNVAGVIAIAARGYQYQSRLLELVVSPRLASPRKCPSVRGVSVSEIPLPQGRGDIHHPLSRSGFHCSHPTACAHSQGRFSLNEHSRKFLTASAPTGPPYTAPALVHQGLQPILLKRQRLNPSRPCQEFRHPLAILDGYAPVDGGQPPAHQHHGSHGIPSADAGAGP